MGLAYDLCLDCYYNGRGCFHSLTMRDGYKMEKLMDIHTQAKEAYIKEIGNDPELGDFEESTE